MKLSQRTFVPGCNLRVIIWNFLKAAKDRIFPVFCLGCDIEGEWLCSRCLDELDTLPVLLCPICHEEQPYGVCCNICVPYSALDSHIAAAVYTQGALVSKILETLKYQYVLDIVPCIEQIMFPQILLQYEFLSQFDFVVPIPLHARRYAERGFNQSDYIAACVAASVGIEVLLALVRSTYTQQQATLEKEAREKNMEGVFQLSDINIKGKDILLVDDVYTTGSTMQAAAKTLRKGGASSVASFSVARG